MSPRRIFAFFLVLFFALNLAAQQTTRIDSLKKILPSKSGKEKVKTLIDLAWEMRVADGGETRSYARQAFAEAQKINDKHGQSDALHKIGIGYYYNDIYDSAQIYYNESYIVARKAGDSSMAAQALGGTGNLYRVTGIYDTAIIYLNRAATIYRKQNDSKNLGASLVYLGDCYQRQSDFVSADKYYKEGMTLAKKSGDYYSEANSIFGLANSQFIQGNFQDAVNWYEKSYAIAEKTQNEGMLSNILAAEANAYRSMYNFPKTIETYLRAKRLAEKNNNKSNLAYVYSGLSDMYFTQRSMDTAKFYQQKSIDLARQIGDKSRLCSSLLTLSEIFAAGKDTAALEKPNNEALDIAQQNNYGIYIGQAMRNMALLSMYKKELSTAETQLKQALAYADSSFDHQGRAEAYRVLTDCYMRQNKINDALVTGDSSYAIAARLESPGTQMECAIQLSKVHERRGDFQKALFYFKKVKEFNDTINSPERTRNQTQQLMQYYFEKEREHQLAESARRESEAKAREDRLTLFIIFGSLLFVLLLVFVFILYRGNRIKQRANAIISEQKRMVDIKNREITDSIQYARNIQQALLPPAESIAEVFPEHFIFFRPRDIVGGDFYWIHASDDLLFFVVGDCTGHGVPGGFMSTLGITYLNEIIIDMKRTAPAEILGLLRDFVINALNKTKKPGESLSRDGMDLALCVIDKKEKKLRFAGANNGIYLIRSTGKPVHEDDIAELRPDKQPIGVHEHESSFTEIEIPLTDEMTIVATTDGYPDQFGGAQGKKFLYKRFRKTLAGLQDKPIREHAQSLEKEFDAWKGSLEQVDDVCVMGVRIRF